MSEIKIQSIRALEWKRKDDHAGYRFEKAGFVSQAEAEHSRVNVYRVPPKMAAYPYHYHLQIEETFYILEGEGSLRTPQGERRVKAGDLIYFPAGQEGAHKLVNDTEVDLVYLDFDVEFVPDVAFYPDSDKIGVYGGACGKKDCGGEACKQDIHLNFRLSNATEYYDGE